jgi:hypothetical protein
MVISMKSASLNRRSENVVVRVVIIAELELGNIEVKVLFADLVIAADDAAFAGISSHRSTRRWRSDLPVGLSGRETVQPLSQKYFAWRSAETLRTDLPVVLKCRIPSGLISPPNQRHILRHPAPHRGALANVTNAGRDAVDAAVLGAHLAPDEQY